ncbi:MULTISPECIES: hypothetical protein [Bacillus]|nr:MULTISPECIES: hypothetical protein [Bacillus]
MNNHTDVQIEAEVITKKLNALLEKVYNGDVEAIKNLNKLKKAMDSN